MRESIYRDGGVMTNVTPSHCSRFSRRSDMNIFNMTDYTTCENCRHITPDHQCLVKMDTSIGRFE